MFERAMNLGSRISFALGAVWGVAGAGKIVFGERITIPILPALDLRHVDALGALAVALACFAAAAWMGRQAKMPLVDDSAGASIAHDGDAPHAVSSGAEGEMRYLGAQGAIGQRVPVRRAPSDVDPLPVRSITPNPSS